MSVVSQVDTIVCAWVIDRQFLAPGPTVHSSPPPQGKSGAFILAIIGTYG